MASPFARLSPQARLVALVLWEAGARPGESWSKDVPTLLALTELSNADFIRALVELRLAACLWYSFDDHDYRTLTVCLARALNKTNERNDCNNIYNNVNETNVTRNVAYTTRTSTDENRLAIAGELASRLDEPHRLDYYQRLVARYPESQLRRALTDCANVPHDKIKKSRAALFHYLLKIYASKES